MNWLRAEQCCDVTSLRPTRSGAPFYLSRPFVGRVQQVLCAPAAFDRRAGRLGILRVRNSRAVRRPTKGAAKVNWTPLRVGGENYQYPRTWSS